MSEIYGDNLAHLQGALAALNLRLHRQVWRWRATHHPQATPDELLGLYTSDRDIDALLHSLYLPPEADQGPIAKLSALLEEAEARHAKVEAATLAAGVPLRLPLLAERLGLDAFERQIVLLALAPELDRRYERLFGYLNDDVTRRLPSVELALQLYCDDLAERVARRKSFAVEAPLRALRVISLEPTATSLLASGLKPDERVVGYLLGVSQADPVLTDLLQAHPGEPVTPVLNAASVSTVARLYAYFASHPMPAPVVSMTGPDVNLNSSVAAHLAHAYGSTLFVLDGAGLSAQAAPEEVVARGVRELRLHSAALAVRGADVLMTSRPSALRRLLEDDQPRFLLAGSPWPVSDLPETAPLLTLHLPMPDAEARQRLWAASLDGQAGEVDVRELAERFRLTSAQIAAAASHARARAASLGHEVERADLFAGCQIQSSTALDGLAQHFRSIHGWDDLVVPTSVKAQLRSLEHWMHYRHVVYGAWGYDRRVMLGRGLAVLFSGPSGTGKTMAAGILARSLELELYRVDLSSVVSKYIGETEKNLSRIFTAAESANAILFFDEADALFGKRSEVKDAHDRYANIEVSYLLQRMEAYDGVAILATNFRQNLDQAFARRVHLTVEFPLPQASDRERIWRRLLPASVPQDALELGYLASHFAFAGGNIKNCVLAAAFAAAAEASPITMRHLIQAVARELEKIDQPIVRSEFGPYYELMRSKEAL